MLSADGVKMINIVVVGDVIGAGASTVAVGIAQLAADNELSVNLRRFGSDDRSLIDAQNFSELLLDGIDTGTGAPSSALELADNTGNICVIEVSSKDEAELLNSFPDSKIIYVQGSESNGRADASLTIRNRNFVDENFSLGEDRLLAAPTVGDLINATDSAVLTRSVTGEREICEHVVIGAISHDPADDYFGRFGRKAVVVRAEKVDLGLAALLSGAQCLILTGGHEPSPYLLDRAAASRDTTVILSPSPTATTAKNLEGTFGMSPFSHSDKARRIKELIAQKVDATKQKELFF
jgi:hypothetical protein